MSSKESLLSVKFRRWRRTCEKFEDKGRLGYHEMEFQKARLKVMGQEAERAVGQTQEAYSPQR